MKKNLCILALLAISACSDKDDDTHTVDSGPVPNDGGMTADGSTVEDASTDASADDAGMSFQMNDAGQVLCGTAPCGCSNGLDDDADGLVDLADPECISAWDNDEGSFATGIPGDNRDNSCQDCFFDGNSGSGDDGCRIPSSCLTTGLPTSGQGNCNSCSASAQCENFCTDFTPNGCDCFGCCAVQLGSNIVEYLLLANGCNIDGSSHTGCTVCTQSTTCTNTCGRCELCPGKTAEDLPADCTSGGGTVTPSCDNGEPSCGADLPACAIDYVCSYGCCILSPVIVI